MSKTINNEIQEDYCSLEVSRLLKEKGFNVWCKSHYELALTSKKNKQDGHAGPFGWKKGELNIQSDGNSNLTLKDYYNDKTWYACSRPTHAVAIKWIRDNHRIYINVVSDFWKKKWVHKVELNYLLDNYHSDLDENIQYASYEEATEQGLLYVLNNLI